MNAREELMRLVGTKSVDYVCIVHDEAFDAPRSMSGSLEKVLPMIDFDYVSGFGSQKLFGYVWFSDGTWAERREYDGSEWWVHVTRPQKMTGEDLVSELYRQGYLP